MTIFDPTSFLNATTTEASLKRPPLPAGSDFVGVITALEPRTWQGKKDPTKSGVALDATIEIDMAAYPGVEAGGATRVVISDSIMLDLTDGGTIDYSPGKNGKLRRYREALGLNTPGAVFSPQMMVGRPIKVKISHREYEGELYDQIEAVTKA